MERTMKNIIFLCCAAAVLLLTGCTTYRVYVGGSDGIHKVEYSYHPQGWWSEKLTDSSHVSYMAISSTTLYAARRLAKGVCGVDVFKIGFRGSLQKCSNFVIPGKHGYCHISLSKDGKYLFGSSYSGAFLDVLALNAEGGIAALKERIHFSGHSIHKRQKHSHPHFATQTPDGSMVLVADLGGDRIHTFKYDGSGKLLRGESVALPPGSGPRHLSFSADGKLLFAANELNNTVTSFKVENGTLKLVASCSLLPAEWSGTSYAGAIKTAPCGTVFVTNRGHNSIAAVTAQGDGKLKLASLFSSEGDFPYDLTFAKEKLFLFNMKSDQFSVWEKGEKWEKKAELTLRRPMCVVTPEP